MVIDMRKWFVALLLIIGCYIPDTACAGSVVTNSGQAISSFPWSLSFDSTGDWDVDGVLTSDECGGTARRVTTGCYAGAGCLKVIPPTSACAGGGYNGGAVGAGWFSYSNTSRIHIRFMIWVGPTFYESITNGGGGLINKFVLQDNNNDYPRTGILGFNAESPAGSGFVAFGVLAADESYHYNASPTEPGYWQENAAFYINDTTNHSTWICVEYWIDTADGESGLYIWTAAGLQDSFYITNAVSGSATQTGFYFSYFNCYGVADADNYYIIDDLSVSNSYIGPPDGFVGGGGGTQYGRNSGGGCGNMR